MVGALLRCECDGLLSSESAKYFVFLSIVKNSEATTLQSRIICLSCFTAFIFKEKIMSRF